MTGIILASAMRLGWVVAVALVEGLFLMAVIYRKPFLAPFSGMGTFSGSPSAQGSSVGRAAATLGGAYLGTRLAASRRNQLLNPAAATTTSGEGGNGAR